MNRFAALLVMLSALVPAGILAETVGVRSGDHAGFTRLVIDFTEQKDWEFGRVDGGFEFRPAQDDVTYRLDQVFERIGRNRIEDVRDLGDGRLYLAVSCDCHAVVDELSNGKIVLDITRGAAPSPGSGFDAKLVSFDSPPEDQAVVGATPRVVPVASVETSLSPGKISDRAGLPLTLPRPGSFATIPANMPRPTPPTSDMPAEPAATASAPGMATEDNPTPDTADPGLVNEDVRAARISKTEAALLEQVARAAAQGLLEADMSDIEENVAGSVAEPVEVSPPPAIVPPPVSVTQRGHIAVETSVDRAFEGSARHVRETDDGDACIDPAFFDVGDWGEEIGSGTDIGTYRSGLVTELDVADGAGVSALVHNYIYITFGAEAQALLRRYPDSVERPDLLFAMAEIMDAGWSTKATDLVDQMTCDGATALWAALAQKELRPGQEINRNAVAMAFSALPVHLRRHLGPELAKNLLVAGDQGTADLIRAAIDRAGDPSTSGYGMMTAKFELEAGEVDRASKTLDDVVAAGDVVLPEALLQRVDATLAAGGAVAEDVVVLLDSLAFQYRGSDTEEQMLDAAIRARASAGDFNLAFEQLGAADDAGLFTSERRQILRAGLFDRVTQDTDDSEFLRLSLPRLEQVADLPVEPKRAVAGRLLKLGFARPARTALGAGTAIPDPADREILARAALVENKPAVAIGYLAGLNEPSALNLRAEALDMAQDRVGAMRAYEAAGDPEKVVRMAWRGGLWPDVARLDQGALGTAAQLMVDESSLGRDSVPPDGQIALADAQQLIAQSKAARLAVNALLDEVASPEADPVAANSPSF